MLPMKPLSYRLDHGWHLVVSQLELEDRMPNRIDPLDYCNLW